MTGENVDVSTRTITSSSRRSVTGFVIAAALFASAGTAHAQAAWTAPQNSAMAMLPDPEAGTAVTTGILFCEAQKWTLTLALEPDAEMTGVNGIAVLTARSQPFNVEAKAERGAIDIAIPLLALEPMMAGTRLQIAFPGEKNPVRFSLSGSRRAITAVQGQCTPRQMPDLNNIELSVSSPYLELGRQLREDDIRDFVLSTNSLPDLRAGILKLDGNRQLVFAEMCGSSWYFGVSGCSLAGFARNTPEDEGAEADETAVDTEGWMPVFESEGAYLYLDPARANDGWPNLISIPLKPGFDDQHWAWDGERYAAANINQAEAEPEE